MPTEKRFDSEQQFFLGGVGVGREIRLAGGWGSLPGRVPGKHVLDHNTTHAQTGYVHNADGDATALLTWLLRCAW